MSMMPDDQSDNTAIPLAPLDLIPWDPEVRTLWSDEHTLKTLSAGPPFDISAYVNYFLWDSTTECMVSIGVPTYADVRMWLEWLRARPDATTEEIVGAIQACEEYIKP